MRSRILFTASIILALLLSISPPVSSAAMGNPQSNPPNCPPYSSAQVNNPGFIKSLPKECRGKYRLSATPQLRTLNQFALSSSGGPDDFGYTYDDTVPFNWISASTDSGLADDDAASSPFNIGFDFPFYGLNYSELYFTTNGLITFNTFQSLCCTLGASGIPDPALPNSYIAPFWDDLVVGSPDNSGGIYYEQGGTAPDRYLVLEWRDVTTYAGSDPFSFEAILYENGDILIQHQSLPAEYYSTVGIENSTGDDGLSYQLGDSGLSSPKAIKFTHPTAPTPRLLLSSLNASRFARVGNDTYLPLTITNIGSAGTDTYNLSATSAWSASFYQYDAINDILTPLTDTNGDTIIDTGPVPQGSSIDISVGFTPPAGAGIGDSNTASLDIASSLDPSKTKTAEFNMVIPAPFVHVFEDYVDAANVFRVNQPDGLLFNYVTDNLYYANGLATINLPDGRYLYTWRKPDGDYPNSFSDIEFTFVSHDGTTNTPISKLTSNTGMGQTYDYSPAVAVAPDGTIGVTWYRWLVDNTTGQSNYNIYFATLSSTGTLLYGPINVTNNNAWDNFDDVNVPHFFSPSIASTDDNRFVLSWNEYQTDGENTYINNIWYATRSSDGTSVFDPTALTSDNSSYSPVLNSLSGNRVILTWESDQVPAYYVVLNSDGSLAKPATALAGTSRTPPDAVMLPNGKVALAWATTDQEIALVMLDASYDVTLGPILASNPYSLYNRDISITYDFSNHIIMTWTDDDSDPASQLFYAMADDTGAFISNPIPITSSSAGLITAENGQGNAPILSPVQETMDVNIDIRPFTSANIISLKWLFVPVAILSTADFNAPQMAKRDSLTFGKTGDEDSRLLCLKHGIDVNHDRKPDLICYFRIHKTGFASGDTEGILKGLTMDNVPFEGTNSVKILKH